MSADHLHTHYKFTLNEPGARKACAELVALDEDTARRMLATATAWWKIDELRLVVVDRNVRGPSRLILLDPAGVPKEEIPP